MMSEDLANSTIQASQKSIELAKTLYELLARILNSGKNLALGTGKVVGKAIVSLKNNTDLGKVIKAAEQGNCNIMQESGIPKSDVNDIKKMCKERGIPVEFKSKRGMENATAIYPETYKAAFSKVLEERVKNKLSENPQEFAVFKVKENEISALKSLCNKNDISVNFIKTDNGILCTHSAKDRAAMEIIKGDFKTALSDVQKNFECSYNANTNKYTLTDKSLNKTIELNGLKTHSKISSILTEKFGYDPIKAELAADKFGGTLTPEASKFFNMDTRQRDIISNLDRSLKTPVDHILTRDYEFTRINYKADGLNRFVVTKGELATVLIPATMKRKELETAIREKLGVTDNETVKAICDKAENLNNIYSSKHNIATDKGDFKIERTSGKEFSVSQGTTENKFSFANKDVAIGKIQRTLGVSKDKASEIFDKAKSQNVLANKIKNAQAKSANKKDKPIKEKKQSKGGRT